MFVVLGVFLLASCTKESNKETKILQVTSSQIINALKQHDPNATISSLVESRTDPFPPLGTPCFVTPDSGAYCTANHIVTTLSLPASYPRPACNDMNVEFDLVICQLLNGTYTLSFSEFEAFYGNCPAFDTWYDSLTPEQKAEEQDKWEYELSILTEFIYVQAIAQLLPANCPEVVITSFFITEICYNRCLVPSEVFPGFRVIKSFCGTQCCVRKREACKGISGFVLFGPESFETKGPACTSTITVCKFNAIPLSQNCGVVCGPK